MDRVDRKLKKGHSYEMSEQGFLTRYVVKKGLLGKPLPPKPAELELTKEEIEYLKGFSAKIGKKPLLLTSGEVEQALLEAEVVAFLETVEKESDRLMISSALADSAHKAQSLAPEGEGSQPLIEEPIAISGPPAVAPPIAFEKFMEDFPTDYRVGLRAQFDSSEGWALAYEDKTGVPVYRGCIRPIIEAGKTKLKDNKHYGEYISGIFRGISSKEMDDITIYMKTAQLIGAAEPLSPKLMRKVDEIRAMFDFGFQRFGVPSERYIIDYLPLLTKAEQDRLDTIPVSWRGFPDAVIPFFQHLRVRTGVLLDDFSVEDLLRLYFNAGTWAEYRDVLKMTGDIAKTFPVPAKNEIKKLDVFLTGGVSDFDKAFQKSTSDFISRVSGNDVLGDTDAMTALVNMVYLGTIAFNPGPAVRNLTQSFHNWSETPAKWMAIGNKLYFSKEGQRILEHSGIETGFAPYAQRNVERYYGKSVARKIVATQSRLRNVGMYMFQIIDHYNRGTIYLAEWARCNHYIDTLKEKTTTADEFHRGINLAGLHPTIQKMVLHLEDIGEWESLVDLVADFRQRVTQYRYQREVRPQWMRTGTGKIAGQFLTWPTYAIGMHGGRYKRAQEAFQKGQTREGSYEIWKEIKWAGMVATTAYLGAKAGLRLWPWFQFLPAQVAAAVQPVYDLYRAAVLKFSGYDWPATKKWSDFKWSSKIYIPAGVEVGNIVRGIQMKSVPKMLGLPVYPKEELPQLKPRKPLWEEKTAQELVDEWRRGQQNLP